MWGHPSGFKHHRQQRQQHQLQLAAPPLHIAPPVAERIER
jgi:hypothetical protein